MTSPIHTKGELFDTAASIVQQKLSQLSGVGQVQVVGGSLPAVRIDLNPQQLNSYGIGTTDVAQILSQQNSNRPKGQISDDFITADINANDQIMKAKDYAPLVIGTNSNTERSYISAM
jgi:multidrug efflux pump